MIGDEVPLGQLLHRALEPIALDPSMTYKQITLRLHHRGAVLRGTRRGAELGASRQYRARTGQLIISRIDARNGAIALVPDHLDGAVVTNDFWLFDIDETRIVPKFLDQFVGTPTFIDLLRQASEGTTNRVRLQLERFLRLLIGVPPLPLQRQIVARVEAMQNKIEEASRLQNQLSADLLNLARTMAHRSDLSESEKTNLGWTRTTLGEVLEQTREADPVEVTKAYPNLGILSYAKGVFEKPPIEGARTSASTLYRVRAGQFIYSRLFAFEGAYATVPPHYDGYFVSNEFPTFSLDREKITEGFLNSHFLDSRVWVALAMGSKGLGDRRQRVHPDQVLAHAIWLPPLEWQRTIDCVFAKVDESRNIQRQSGEELDALMPAILVRAFRGDL